MNKYYIEDLEFIRDETNHIASLVNEGNDKEAMWRLGNIYMKCLYMIESHEDKIND